MENKSREGLQFLNKNDRQKVPIKKEKTALILPSSFRFHHQFLLFSEKIDDDVTMNSAVAIGEQLESPGFTICSSVFSTYWLWEFKISKQMWHVLRCSLGNLLI